MDAVREDVIKLVEKELESANKMYPPFHNAHEGYAVILEELEEAEEQLKYAKDRLKWMWGNIKYNAVAPVVLHTKQFKETAVCLAIESIQVAAMAQKFIDSLGGKDE